MGIFSRLFKKQKNNSQDISNKERPSTIWMAKKARVDQPQITPKATETQESKREFLALLRQLQSKVSTEREEAADALGQIGDARAVEPLVALLRDEYSFVRQAAARALGQIGDARAVEPLVATLRDRDREWPVRQAAARALGQIGDARAVEPLVATLRDENSPIRETAAGVLTLLGWQPGNDAQRVGLAISQGTGLTLRELVNPVFPYVAPNDRVNEISVDSPLHPAITARGAFLGKQCQLTEYLRILQDAATTCPHEDLPYVWLAELHLMQGRYTEAKQWALQGLNKAREFERLTYVLASVYLSMSDSAAIGWFMQSCLLATFEFIPYLFCARCAEVAELNGLYPRLFNASDAISPGRRVPDDEARVVSLALKVDRTELVNAMSTFQANMDSFLPAADAFPEHPDERDIFIWAHDDIRRDIRAKLFARPQTRTEWPSASSSKPIDEDEHTPQKREGKMQNFSFGKQAEAIQWIGKMIASAPKNVLKIIFLENEYWAGIMKDVLIHSWSIEKQRICHPQETAAHEPIHVSEGSDIVIKAVWYIPRIEIDSATGGDEVAVFHNQGNAVSLAQFVRQHGTAIVWKRSH